MSTKITTAEPQELQRGLSNRHIQVLLVQAFSWDQAEPLVLQGLLLF